MNRHSEGRSHLALSRATARLSTRDLEGGNCNGDKIYEWYFISRS